MAERNYKKNEAIIVRYQAANCKTGLTPIMEIFDETGQKDTVNFPDQEMVEITNAPGRYYATFTPDAVGEWMITIHDGTGKGKVSYSYSVGDYNLQDVGDTVATLDSKVDAVDTKVTTIDGKIDTVTTTVNGIDTQLDTVETKIDNIADAVENLGEYTPPFVF